MFEKILYSLFRDQQEKGNMFTHGFARKRKNFGHRCRGKGRTFVIDVGGRGRRLVPPHIQPQYRLNCAPSIVDSDLDIQY